MYSTVSIIDNFIQKWVGSFATLVLHNTEMGIYKIGLHVTQGCWKIKAL
jgi:hypothetical protein